MNQPLPNHAARRTTRRLDFGADSIALRRLLRHLVSAAFRVDAYGTVREAHFPEMRAPDVWLHSTPSDRPHIADVIFDDDADATAMRLNLEQLFDDFLPEELTIAQLPERTTSHGTEYRLEYVVERQQAVVDSLLILVHADDSTTDAAQKARADAEFRHVTEKLMENPEASRGFFGETEWLMEQVVGADDAGALKRHLHTLKGNFGCFGFDSLAEQVHQVEDLLVSQAAHSVAEDVAAVERTWQAQCAMYGPMFSAGDNDQIIVSRMEYEELVMNLMMQTDYAELLGHAQRWSLDPISSVFARLSMQARRVASLTNRHVEIVNDHNFVRLPGGGLRALWSSLVHIAVNAVVHGIESPDERVEAGKPVSGTFRMHAELTDDDLRIEFADDGRGINWDALRARAEHAGLPATSHDDLVRALFASGITTAGETSIVAGRGVGTAAVWAEVEALGGAIDVTSEPGVGTTFTIAIPLARLATMGLVS